MKKVDGLLTEYNPFLFAANCANLYELFSQLNLLLLKEIIYQEEANTIVGIYKAIHRQLGHGFLEVVYKDGMWYDFKNEQILFEREKAFNIQCKGAILKYQFIADFILMDKIIVEIKANKEGISSNTTAQTINYLKVSGCKLGIIINFGSSFLQYKRLVLS